MSDDPLASPEQPLPSPVLADARAVSSTVLVSEGLTTPGPSYLSFVAASPSLPGLPLVCTIALLLHVVHLVTGEPDLTIHKLASPDYETAVLVTVRTVQTSPCSISCQIVSTPHCPGPLLRFDLAASVDTSSLLVLGCRLCILRAAVACKSSIPALALLAVVRSSRHNCPQARWARRATALGQLRHAPQRRRRFRRFGFVVSFRCGAQL
jgi:hypothetical protein